MAKKLLTLGILFSLPILLAVLATSASHVTAAASPTAQPLLAAVNTPIPAPTGTVRPLVVETVAPTPDPYVQDSDGDLLPDAVEQAMGADPQTHECTANLNLDFSVLLIFDGTLWQPGEAAEAGRGDTATGPSADATMIEMLRSTASILPTGVRTGVMAAGTGAAGEACMADSIFPLQSISRQSLQLNPGQVQPSGQRPLGNALRDAPMMFAGVETGLRRVVLVSRGGDTCGGDPCQEARALKTGPLAITVDTIAVGADAATQTMLQCVADYTGGLYYQADTSAGLKRIWRLQNERLSRWMTSANNTQEQSIGCLRCMFTVLDRFLKWARDSGFSTQQPQQFQRIVDQITRNLQC